MDDHDTTLAPAPRKLVLGFQDAEDLTAPDPADHARAWAAALVLILFILFVSLAARWLATRSRRKIAQASR